MDDDSFIDKFGGPVKPIKINEIQGLWAFLTSIDWSEPWFSGLVVFHVICAILTVLSRKKGMVQAVYFGVLMVVVLCAEFVNEWAAANWNLFARQQYFDSNGLFISVVFSMPLLMNCLVLVVFWLWDVGMLISNLKQIKIRRLKKRQEKLRNDANNALQKDTESGSQNAEQKKEN